MSNAQIREFHAAVIRWLPDLESRDMQFYIDDQKALARALQRLEQTDTVPQVQAPQILTPRPYPPVGEPFELTMPEPIIKGLEMPKNDGYGNWREWKFLGKEMRKSRTGLFMLVEVGAQPASPKAKVLREALKVHGSLIQGQWREAFKAAFPEPDGKGPIGIADPSWLYPRRDAGFPYVHTVGNSRFDWTGYGFNGCWRWLVGVRK